MGLILFTESQQNSFEAALTTNHSSFLQSWQWGQFQKEQGRIIIRAGWEENGKLKLVGQFIEHQIPYLKGTYLYCGYGPVGDMSYTGKLTKSIHNALPQYWFIKLEPTKTLPELGQSAHRIQPGKTLITNISKSPEELLASMHPKTRYNIKVAQKHNVAIKVATSPKEYGQALNLIISTSQRQGFRDHPTSYYEGLINSQVLKPKVYLASHDQQFLSAAIMIDHNDTRTYLFGGSSADNKNLMAPYLLHWQAMMDAKQLGLTNYDWWGIETSKGSAPGFVRFKLGWGGQEVTYPTPQDIVTEPFNYQLYRILRSISQIF